VNAALSKISEPLTSEELRRRVLAQPALLNGKAPKTAIAGAHRCFYGGCHEMVGPERYHCERHEAILERRRTIIAERNRKNAAARRERRP
jgi:hypothetical protein